VRAIFERKIILKKEGVFSKGEKIWPFVRFREKRYLLRGVDPTWRLTCKSSPISVDFPEMPPAACRIKITKKRKETKEEKGSVHNGLF
jgi:hypothetical protein